MLVTTYGKLDAFARVEMYRIGCSMRYAEAIISDCQAFSNAIQRRTVAFAVREEEEKPMPSRYVTITHARVEHLQPGDLIRFMDEGRWVENKKDENGAEIQIEGKPVPKIMGGWLKVSEPVVPVGNDGSRLKVEDQAGDWSITERRAWAVVQVQMS